MSISNQKPSDGEFYSGKEILDLERERLRSADRRTDAVRLAIECNNDADKRMFDFHMARIQSESGLKHEQLKLTRLITISGGIVAASIIVLLFGMLFFGDERQSELALSLLKNLATALSGIGLYLLGKTALGKLVTSSDEP